MGEDATARFRRRRHGSPGTASDWFLLEFFQHAHQGVDFEGLDQVVVETRLQRLFDVLAHAAAAVGNQEDILAPNLTSYMSGRPSISGSGAVMLLPSASQRSPAPSPS